MRELKSRFHTPSETLHEEETDELGWTEHERAEKKIVSQFISFMGSSHGGKDEDTKLARRALDYYAHPDHAPIIRKWIREKRSDKLNEYTQVYREFNLHDALLYLSDRARERAKDLRVLGWSDIPVRTGLSAWIQDARDYRV